jgi:predicted MFS family arabinose efflux permease
MDAAGFNWTLLTIVGPALLAVAILWALLRNKRSRRTDDIAEEGTRRVYEQEEAERRSGGPDGGPKGP